MDRVQLDLGAIALAATNATTIKSTFDDSGDSSDRVAEACGHDGLADAVTEFADSWDDRRANFAENLGTLATTLTALCTAFRDLDQRMSHADAAPIEA